MQIKDIKEADRRFAEAVSKAAANAYPTNVSPTHAEEAGRKIGKYAYLFLSRGKSRTSVDISDFVGPLGKTDLANTFLHTIDLVFLSEKHIPFGAYVDIKKEGRPLNATIYVNLYKMIVETYVNWPNGCYRWAKENFGHELRHAVDWADSLARRGEPEDFDRANPPNTFDRDTERNDYYDHHFNLPTEIQAYAGNIAQKIYNQFGDKALEMEGNTIWEIAQTEAPVIFRYLKVSNSFTLIKYIIEALHILNEEQTEDIDMARQVSPTFPPSSTADIIEMTTDVPDRYYVDPAEKPKKAGSLGPSPVTMAVKADLKKVLTMDMRSKASFSVPPLSSIPPSSSEFDAAYLEDLLYLTAAEIDYTLSQAQGRNVIASLRLSASPLVLHRSGFRTYEGTCNGKVIKIRRDEVVAHGSFPRNKRQRRNSVWSVFVDGTEVGSTPTMEEARALALKSAALTLRAYVNTLDSEGHSNSTRIQDIHAGDRVRLEDDSEADVLRVDQSGVIVSLPITEAGQTASKEVRVPVSKVTLLLSSDDPRA